MECHVCQKQFMQASLGGQLASQYWVYHVHLLAEKKVEGVCTPARTKPKVWTGVSYPVTSKLG